MDIALCYESVLPARGGAETYIGDLARRLARDGHAVHLYASRWDAAALPATTHFHRLDVVAGPRFLRPWRFGWACERALGSTVARCQHRLRQDLGAGHPVPTGRASRRQCRAEPAQVPRSTFANARPGGQVVRPRVVVFRTAGAKAVFRSQTAAGHSQQPHGAGAFRAVLWGRSGLYPRRSQRHRLAPLRGRRPAQAAARRARSLGRFARGDGGVVRGDELSPQGTVAAAECVCTHGRGSSLGDSWW